MLFRYIGVTVPMLKVIKGKSIGIGPLFFDVVLFGFNPPPPTASADTSAIAPCLSFLLAFLLSTK